MCAAWLSCDQGVSVLCRNGQLHCRKVHAGAVSFTSLSAAIDTIDTISSMTSHTISAFASFEGPGSHRSALMAASLRGLGQMIRKGSISVLAVLGIRRMLMHIRRRHDMH